VVALAHLKNESTVPAFNIRFGVEYGGTRFPYKMEVDDPDEGNYQRVVPPGERLPERQEHSIRILIASEDVWASANANGDLDEGRVYWCRYENARGETWETRNPGSRSGKLDIHRVRKVKRLEEREKAQRDQVRQRGREWEGQALETIQESFRRRVDSCGHPSGP